MNPKKRKSRWLIVAPEAVNSHSRDLFLISALPGTREKPGGLTSKCLLSHFTEATCSQALALGQFNRGNGPLAILPLDGNPQPVEFVQPHFLSGPGLAIGQDYGLADKFGFRLLKLAHDSRGPVVRRWPRWVSVFCAVHFTAWFIFTAHQSNPCGIFALNSSFLSRFYFMITLNGVKLGETTGD